MISFTKVLISNVTRRKKNLDTIPFVYFYAAKSGQSYDLKVSFRFYLLLSIIILIHLSNYRRNFIQQVLIWKVYSRLVWFDQKILILILVSKISIVQIFRKVVNEHASVLLSKWCFSVTTVLIFFMRITISIDTLNTMDSNPISLI